MSTLTHWRSWLAGLDDPFEVHPDHQGLKHFFTKQKLNSRQAAWGQKLSEFNFNVFYKPGTQMGWVDVISRRTGNEEAGGFEQLLVEGEVLVLNSQNLSLEGIDILGWEKNKNGLWVVPAEHRDIVLRQCHDSGVVGHWGRDRTRELISWNFV